MKSVVLCYNLKETKKGRQVAMIFGFLGYKIRHVEKEEYLWPIGKLAGMEKVERETEVYDGEGFEEEMLVIQAASEDMLDKALFHYKPNARWGESYRTLAALLYPQLADQLEALA